MLITINGQKLYYMLCPRELFFVEETKMNLYYRPKKVS